MKPKNKNNNGKTLRTKRNNQNERINTLATKRKENDERAIKPGKPWRYYLAKIAGIREKIIEKEKIEEAIQAELDKIDKMTDKILKKQDDLVNELNRQIAKTKPWDILFFRKFKEEDRIMDEMDKETNEFMEIMNERMNLIDEIGKIHQEEFELEDKIIEILKVI